MTRTSTTYKMAWRWLIWHSFLEGRRYAAFDFVVHFLFTKAYFRDRQTDCTCSTRLITPYNVSPLFSMNFIEKIMTETQNSHNLLNICTWHFLHPHPEMHIERGQRPFDDIPHIIILSIIFTKIYVCLSLWFLCWVVVTYATSI